jgi:glycerol uptake facilitator-like aquaporin
VTPDFTRLQRVAVEAIGTALLVATVVGSGVMADRLTEDTALALLANASATGAMLIVLITIFSPISGAHFNPAVTLVFALGRDLDWGDAVAYVAAQVAGGVIGTVLAHAMFEMPPLELAANVRTGPSQWLSEFVAAFGLVTAILLGRRANPGAVPWLVGLYIVAAYWFTASTSFANPAVTLARALTDSFSGIRPVDAPAFIAAQALGALVAWAICVWLFRSAKAQTARPDPGRAGPALQREHKGP